MNSGMKKGFTIIETMLAMLFIGIMMVAIAVLVRNVSETYSKGITIKNVNEASRAIIDDLERTISASPTFGAMKVGETGYATVDTSDVDETGSGDYHVCQTYIGDKCVVNYDATIYFNAENRRFCTGLASYIWNYRDNLENENVDFNTYQGASDPNSPNYGRQVRLVKVKDYTRKYCKEVNTAHEYPTISDEDSPEELIDPSEENLVLYGFVVYENEDRKNINPINGQVFYSGSFVLGSWGGVELNGLNPECVPPGEATEFQEYYCSVNKFNFSQRAMGSSQ